MLRRFATGLSGRFHAAGVSGSMQQHHHQEGKKKTARLVQRSARDIHQANVESELEEDAKQLAELEEKLMEIRRQKQIRQERKETRKLIRMQNKKAALIQRAWAAHLIRQRDKAVDQIKKFIQTSANKQACIIGGWAAGTLRRFAIRVSYIWLEERRRREMETMETMRRLEEEDRRRMILSAVDQVAHSSVHTILEAVYQNIVALKEKKKSSVLTPNRKRKMKNAHRILGPNVIEKQLSSDRPISPITTPQKERQSPIRHIAECQPSKGHADRQSSSKVAAAHRETKRLPVDVQLSPSKRKKVLIQKSNLSEERRKKVAELHRERLEEMEVERLRRLERVEQQKAEAEAAASQERLERQIEEEDKARKKEAFMLRLEEQQQQLAREAEIVRLIREKANKEKEEEDARQKHELKLMAQFDNFYVITAKILGGGCMSLQKRLFAKGPGNTGDHVGHGSNSLSRATSSVAAQRVSSAPHNGGGSRSRDKHSRIMEKSASAGTETFLVPGELSMTALRPSGPEGLLEHRSPCDDDSHGTNRSPDNDSRWQQQNNNNSVNISRVAHSLHHSSAGKQSERYLAQHRQKAREQEAIELSKKIQEDQEAERKAEALMLAREQAQVRIAQRARAERERQQEQERLEEQRRLSSESEAAKQAREATRRRVAERARLEKEKKAADDELEEAKKKKQAELLEKAHDLILKTKKMTYAMSKMKSRNGKAKKERPLLPPSTFGTDPEESSQIKAVCAQEYVNSNHSNNLRNGLKEESADQSPAAVLENAETTNVLLKSRAGKAMPWEGAGKMMPPSLSSFGIASFSAGPDSDLPCGEAPGTVKPKLATKKQVVVSDEAKKPGMVSELFDIVARAREKLNVRAEDNTVSKISTENSSESFTAAYSAPIRKKNICSVKQKCDKTSRTDEKSFSFKPLTLKEMMSALGPNYSLSPLSMEYPSIPTDTNLKRKGSKKLDAGKDVHKHVTKNVESTTRKSGKSALHNKVEEQEGERDRSDQSDLDEEASGYEDMLNDECERLRTMLEKKMSSLQPVENYYDSDEQPAEVVAHQIADDYMAEYNGYCGGSNITENDYVTAASNAYAEYISAEGVSEAGRDEKNADDDEGEAEDQDLLGHSGGGFDVAVLQKNYGDNIYDEFGRLAPF